MSTQAAIVTSHVPSFIEMSVMNFKLHPPEQKFIYMMSSENLKIIKWVASFVKDAGAIRGGTNNI